MSASNVPGEVSASLGNRDSEVIGVGVGVGIKPHLFALLGAFLFAIVVTYPTILHFTTQVPGELIADRDQHYWNFWWISQAFSQPTNPLHTPMLYYPYGVPLYYHVLNIPAWVIGIIPQLIWGYAAAYNTVIIAAFTLSVYAAFRLAVLITGKPWAAFIGGMVFAFTPYTLGAIADGQNEVFSIFWIPIFAECWLRAWQKHTIRDRIVPLILAGLFFAAGGYTTLYYPVDFAIFIAVYAAYMLLTRPDRRATFIRLVINSAIMGAAALLIMAPLIAGLAANFSNPRLDIEAGETQMIGHSADLAGLIAFPHDHPITGATRYGTDKLPVRDNLTLGWFSLALAAFGAVISWRNRAKSSSTGTDTRFWVAFGLTAMIMAMGPYLQITATNVTSIPLPYKLLTNLPVFSGLGKVERYIALTHLAMGILAAWGALYIFNRIDLKRIAGTSAPIMQFAIIAALLLAELPLHPRYTEPFDISPGFNVLAQQPPGGLMELPFATQQNTVIGERMVYQTVHNHPIMAGYLSRNYNSPIIDACSPFWGFISPLDVPREDIASPLVVNRPQDVLNFYGINYIALYENYGGPQTDPIDPDLKSALTADVISKVQDGDSFYRDSGLSLYKVKHSEGDTPITSFHIGAGWYNTEQSGGKPFRWVKEGAGTLCVFAPRQVTASLNLEATAFANGRQMNISAAGHELFTGDLPAGIFTPISTPPIEWQPGVTEVRISTTGPGVTPQSLDPKTADNRSLTVGFRDVNIAIPPQK